MRRGRQIYRKAAKVAKKRRGRGARAEALRRGGGCVKSYWGKRKKRLFDFLTINN
jgi:hypothetical protein